MSPRLTAIAFAITLAVSGCNGEREAAIVKGDRYSHEQVTTQTLYQNFMGAPQDLEHTVMLWMTQTVEAVHEDGSWSSTITFDRAKIRLKSQQLGAFEYDTAVGGTPPEAARAFKLLVGESVQLKTSKQGKVESVEGAIALVDTIFADLGVVRDPETEDVYKEIEAQFGNEALITQFSMTHPGLPAPPYTIGHKWKQVANVGGPYPTIMEIGYEVIGMSSHQITVRSLGVARAAEETTKILDGVPITVVMQGSQTGELTIDERTGITHSMVLTQSLDGHVEMGLTEELKAAAEEADAELPPALRIPTQIKNEIKTTVVKLET